MPVAIATERSRILRQTSACFWCGVSEKIGLTSASQISMCLNQLLNFDLKDRFTYKMELRQESIKSGKRMSKAEQGLREWFLIRLWVQCSLPNKRKNICWTLCLHWFYPAISTKVFPGQQTSIVPLPFRPESIWPAQGPWIRNSCVRRLLNIFLDLCLFCDMILMAITVLVSQ